VKKFLAYAGLFLLIFMISREPEKSADTGASLGTILFGVADSFSTFFTDLVRELAAKGGAG
jgi:hypothetical protein